MGEEDKKDWDTLLALFTLAYIQGSVHQASRESLLLVTSSRRAVQSLMDSGTSGAHTIFLPVAF